MNILLLFLALTYSMTSMSSEFKNFNESVFFNLKNENYLLAMSRRPESRPEPNPNTGIIKPKPGIGKPITPIIKIDKYKINSNSNNDVLLKSTSTGVVTEGENGWIKVSIDEPAVKDIYGSYRVVDGHEFLDPSQPLKNNLIRFKIDQGTTEKIVNIPILNDNQVLNGGQVKGRIIMENAFCNGCRFRNPNGLNTLVKEDDLPQNTIEFSIVDMSVVENNLHISVNGLGSNDHYTSSVYIALSSNDTRITDLNRTKVVFLPNEKNKNIKIPLNINSPTHNLSPYIYGVAALNDCNNCSFKNEGPKAFSVTKAYTLVNVATTGISKEGGEFFWKFSISANRDFDITGSINFLDGTGNLLGPAVESIPWVLSSNSNEVTITRNIARNETLNDNKRIKFQLVIQTEEAAFRYQRGERSALIQDDTSNNP